MESTQLEMSFSRKKTNKKKLTPIANLLHELLSKEPAKDKQKQFSANSIIKPQESVGNQIWDRI